VFHIWPCPDCKVLINNITSKCSCGYIKVVELITLDKYLGLVPPHDPTLLSNAKDLLLKVNSLLQEIGITDVVMTSGYRSPEYNTAIGGAANSKHTTCQAVDLSDNDRIIGMRLYTFQDGLISRGLYCEDLDYCIKKNGSKWVHIQSVAPKSGNRFFIPYAGPPIRK